MLPPEYPERLRTLLFKLINIYSPTGKEQEIVGFLHNYLRSSGLPVSMQKVDGNRANLIVIPPETEACAVILGHLDTVAAYDLDDFGCREEDGVIEGLGAADMKGGCAALIEAYIAAWRKGRRRPPAALALVVGEEEDGDGTRRLVRQYHFPWALIGEPTDMHPCFSHYGYFEIQITTTGKRMHASLANPGQSPVEAMLSLLLRFTRHIADKRPDLVYNIRDLSSSRSGFAVPERCDAWLDIHLPPSAPQGAIIMEMEDILAGERLENPDFSGTMSFSNVYAGYELPEKGDLIETLKQVYAERRIQWEPLSFRSHSDANLLWAAGIKPIILGPGSLQQAHSPNESVSFDQVLLAFEVYYSLLSSLCDKAAPASIR